MSKNIIKKIATTTLPTIYGNFKLYLYHDYQARKNHLALILKQNSQSIRKPTLVRVHSACATGDIFGSLRCDCHVQLHKALKAIRKARSGVLIYLNQEGRGIGLANKIKAYALQDKGLDTAQANEQLGFAKDERNYAIAARILKDLDITRIILLTNNPAKIEDLEKFRLKVKRMVFWTKPTKYNRYYLTTKKKKLGHIL